MKTAVEYAIKFMRKITFSFKLSVIPPYYRDENYIKALADQFKTIC
jgi:protoheme ferro-lyase